MAYNNSLSYIFFIFYICKIKKIVITKFLMDYNSQVLICNFLIISNRILDLIINTEINDFFF